MNTKKIISVAAVGLAIALLLNFTPGCTTTGGGGSGTNTNDISQAQRVAVFIKIVAQLGTYHMVHKYPEAGAYFNAANGALEELLKGDDFSPDRLVQSLQGLLVTHVNDPNTRAEIVLTIASVIELYRAYFNDALAHGLDGSSQFRPILLAIQQGINMGKDVFGTAQRYSLPPPPPSPGQPPPAP